MDGGPGPQDGHWLGPPFPLCCSCLDSSGCSSLLRPRWDASLSTHLLALS